eukprot:Skav211619  [mRNA]  locus=scaffold3083:398276:398515:+ [translate_table: standard]
MPRAIYGGGALKQLLVALAAAGKAQDVRHVAAQTSRANVSLRKMADVLRSTLIRGEYFTTTTTTTTTNNSNNDDDDDNK